MESYLNHFRNCESWNFGFDHRLQFYHQSFLFLLTHVGRNVLEDEKKTFVRKRFTYSKRRLIEKQKKLASFELTSFELTSFDKKSLYLDNDVGVNALPLQRVREADDGGFGDEMVIILKKKYQKNKCKTILFYFFLSLHFGFNWSPSCNQKITYKKITKCTINFDFNVYHNIFDLGRSKSMPGDVNNVINSSGDLVVAVFIPDKNKTKKFNTDKK